MQHPIPFVLLPRSLMDYVKIVSKRFNKICRQLTPNCKR